MRLIAKLFLDTEADWTQSQTDWTKARPGTLRDAWRRNCGCKSRFHTQWYVSPASSDGRISDSYRTAHRLRDRPDKARVALRAEPSRTCQGGARVRYRWGRNIGRGVRGCRQFPPDRNSSRLSSAPWHSCRTGAKPN